MGSEIVKIEEKRMIATARSAGDILAQKKIINDVMEKVMKNGIHYGTIPGCGDKPALLKPGIEALTSTFRIALTHTTEDLSTDDCVRYRVTSTAIYSPTEQVLGDALGECSSDERKYKWRAPVCKEEFDEAAPDRKREFWRKGYQGKPPIKQAQIRTDPADIANTVLKMATKRADAAAIILALGVSDIFAQDIEEWTPEMIAALAGEDQPKVQQPQPKAKPAPAKKAPPKKAAPAPTPEPPAEEPEVVDAEVVEDEPVDDELVGYVVECKVLKSGESSRGPWTMHKVVINEDSFVTFDTRLYAIAEGLKESGSRAVFEYDETDKGLRLTDLREDVPF